MNYRDGGVTLKERITATGTDDQNRAIAQLCPVALSEPGLADLWLRGLRGMDQVALFAAIHRGIPSIGDSVRFVR